MRTVYLALAILGMVVHPTPEKLLAQGTQRFLNLLLEPLVGSAARVWSPRSHSETCRRN